MGLFLSISKRKLLSLGAIIVVASGLGFVKVQCAKIEKIKVENLQLRQQVSDLTFQLEEEKATVKTHELIREGPEAIASATDQIKLRIKPQKGKTFIPTTTVKENGITLLKIDPERQAQIVEDANATKRKQDKINDLKRELDETNEFLRKARATRMRNTVLGFGGGIGVTLLIMKVTKLL